MTLKLFFIDDPPIVADGLMGRFKRSGFKVLGSAVTGDDGLKALAKQPAT